MRHLLSAAMVALSLLFTGCATVGHNKPGIDNFDRVSDSLYRGAQPSAHGVQSLAAQGVKTIINLRDDADPREAAWVKDAGMTYVHLPLDAEKVTPADAEHLLTLIKEAQGPVFVHCFVGRDRTGLACAVYRVREQGWTAQAAIADLDAHGHFWMFFPKVRESITAIAQTAPPVPATRALAAATPKSDVPPTH